MMILIESAIAFSTGFVLATVIDIMRDSNDEDNHSNRISGTSTAQSNTNCEVGEKLYSDQPRI